MTKIKEIWDTILTVPGLLAFFKMIADLLAKKAETIITRNPRPHVMRIIAAMDPDKSLALRNRLDRASRENIPTVENDVVSALGDVIPWTDKDKFEMDQAARIYEWIADLSERDFAVFVYAMKHDPIVQMIRFFVQYRLWPFAQSLFAFLMEAARYSGAQLKWFIEGRARTLFGVGAQADILNALRAVRTGLRRAINAEKRMSWWAKLWC